MLLAIDVGNTNAVFAVLEGADVRSEWRTSTRASRTADEYAVWLSQLMSLEGLSIKDIDQAIIATVVPQALRDLRMLCRRYFGVEAVIVRENAELGIEIKIDNPAEVGADRLANTVGAHVAYGGPLIVVDFGTATNFDVADGDGNFIGGVLASGINLSLEALHMVSAQLPRIAVARPERVIGKGTIAAMQSGVYWGYMGMIEGLVQRIKDEYGTSMKVIGTGGLAPLFADGTAIFDHVDSDLTIRGLKEIHRRTIAARGK